MKYKEEICRKITYYFGLEDEISLEELSTFVEKHVNFNLEVLEEFIRKSRVDYKKYVYCEPVFGDDLIKMLAELKGKKS